MEVPVESVVTHQVRQGIRLLQHPVDHRHGLVAAVRPDVPEEGTRFDHFGQFFLVAIEAATVGVLGHERGQLGGRAELVFAAP